MSSIRRSYTIQLDGNNLIKMLIKNVLKLRTLFCSCSTLQGSSINDVTAKIKESGVYVFTANSGPFNYGPYKLSRGFSDNFLAKN